MARNDNCVAELSQGMSEKGFTICASTNLLVDA